jgi:hypothetical protein
VGDNTRAARLAHQRGALFMGWAAHGDECLGFPGDSNEQIRGRLAQTSRGAGRSFRARLTWRSSGQATA